MAAVVGGCGGQHGTSGVAASGGGEPPREPNNNGGPQYHNLDPYWSSLVDDLDSDDLDDLFETPVDMIPCLGCIMILFDTGSAPECISHSPSGPCTECQRRQRECSQPALRFTSRSLQVVCDRLFRAMGNRTIRSPVDEPRPFAPNVPQELAHIFSPAAIARWSGPVDNNILVNLDRFARGVVGYMEEIHDRISSIEAERSNMARRQQAEPATAVAAQVPGNIHDRVVNAELRRDSAGQGPQFRRPHRDDNAGMLRDFMEACEAPPRKSFSKEGSE